MWYLKDVDIGVTPAGLQVLNVGALKKTDDNDNYNSAFANPMYGEDGPVQVGCYLPSSREWEGGGAVQVGCHLHSSKEGEGGRRGQGSYEPQKIYVYGKSFNLLSDIHQ